MRSRTWLALKHMRFGGALHFNGGGVQKLCGAAKQVDPVAAQLVTHDPGFTFHHLRDASREILNGNAVLDHIIVAVKGAMSESGEVKNGFAQSFTRNGAAVDAERRPTMSLRSTMATRLPSFAAAIASFLTCGPASDDDEQSITESDASILFLPGSRRVFSPAKSGAPSRLRCHVKSVRAQCKGVPASKRNNPGAR